MSFEPTNMSSREDSCKRDLKNNSHCEKDGGYHMLEANTDRSYFMIGAIIVAAVLIGGALYIFRDTLFLGQDAIIPALINDVFSKATKIVADIDGTQYKPK